MLMPEQMNRIILVGSREHLKATVDLLYKSEAVHLIDFPAEEQGFSLGAPLPASSEYSQKLLKLRALEKDLELDANMPVKERVDACNIDAKCDEATNILNTELGQVVEERAKAQSRISELQNEKRALEPFMTIDLPLELYRGYNSLAVSAGHISSDPTNDIIKAVPESEVFLSQDERFIAAFYPKKDASEMQKVLAQYAFIESPLPTGNGSPAERVKTIDADLVELQKGIESTDVKLEELRTKYGSLLAAADEEYSIKVQMAETPLRLGTTPHAFVLDGWVPTSDVEKLKQALSKDLGEKVHLDVLETVSRKESHAHDTEHLTNVDYGHQEEPPTKQSNNRIVKLFEFLTGMISTPKYRELDPTFILAITFPLFFGLMVADVGYGIAFAALGYLGLRRCVSPEWRTIANMIFWGGLWACVFGLFMFGEALGMHFGAVWTEGASHVEYPYGNEITWSWLLQTELPHLGFYSKLVAVKMLLFISLMIGFAHLGLGLGLGFYNKARRYGFKHALLEKFSWILILIGGWFLLIFIIDAVVSPLDSWGFPMLDSYLYIALALILPGTIMAYIGEGGAALLELPGLMSNVMSYTRLTAIAMSKAGLAFAFNTLAFSIIGLSGINAVFAIMVFVVGQLMVFILGCISAGMHAIRLHYVELFQKFFEGGGIEFNPLKIVRKWTNEKEVGE